MTAQTERLASENPFDEELGEQAATYGAMLRAAAERWRLRAQSRPLGMHGLGSVSSLAEALETAARHLERHTMRDAGHDPTGAGPRPDPALEGTEEGFRLLVESVRDYAIFMLDPHGTIISWNAGAERIKGYRADEILGKHFSIFYTPEDIDAQKPPNELSVATEEGRYEEEGWRVRKDGTKFWANVVLTALRDSKGRLRGFAKVTRDFTERKEAEETLRHSEERLRLMIEAVSDYAIFMLDPHGNITSWNEGARRAKGYEANEIIGKNFSTFYTEPDVAAGHPQNELAIAADEGRYEEEGWRIRKDGTRFWANVVISAIRAPGGELLGFTKVTRDLTEKRAAEASLRQLAADLERRVEERTAELVAANQELEAFSYSVSHDLRAPLRALDGFSRMLLSSATEKLNADEKDHLQRIRSAAQRMGQLIDDMLEFSRLSRAPLAHESFDASAAAEHIVADLRRTDATRDVEIAIEPGLNITGDPALLRIAMENLIGNAWKFSRKTPGARIEVGRAGCEGGKLTLFVRDNGAGFDMKYASKLFMPFQRLHSARDFEGTGIGLATVNRIIQRHGGTIAAQSEPGKGTTFYLTLKAEAGR